MIQVTPHVKIFVASSAINFQNWMDGTAAICRNEFEKDPYSGSMFVFINRRKTMIRCYFFDGQGEWLCDKRIAKGSFPAWLKSGEKLTRIEAHQLYLLLRGGNPMNIKTPADWRKIT